MSENSPAIDYQSALNPAQLEAVTATKGPVLVIAGAGSGKTRTLTYRVARLVEQGVPPDAILLLTFTRKAAEEMLRRAGELLDRRCDEVAGGTFHSFSHLLLRRYAGLLGYSTRFVILDRSDCEALVESVKKELFPKTLGRGFPKKRTLASLFSACANKGLEVEAALLADYPHFLKYAEEIADIHRVYHERKRAEGLMDFDDLLLNARALLATDPEIRQVVSSRYQYVMVDEYQDTNLIQADLLRHLSAAHDNIMAVGDDCQSIYAFRGADFENIMRFPEVFPGTKVIRLEENYRSTQPILTMTNKLVDQAQRKYSKTLFTKAVGGGLPLLASFDDEKSQSLWITEEIERLRAKGLPLNQIAVLFRAGFHAFDLEVELTRNQIPYIKMGGFKFMESAHIKDALAHLRVLAYPGDRISWMRVLLLIDHVGPKTATTLADRLAKGETLASIKPKPSWKAGWDRLAAFLAPLKPDSRDVAGLGKSVLEYYAPAMEEQFDNWPKRARDLEQLLAMMERYTSLEAFLSDVTLEPPNASGQDEVLEASGPPGDRLTLSTIHSAKGLEWDAVFVIWALDGRFPSSQAILRQGPALEEELRLLYVAATRARKRLTLTYPTDIFDHTSGTFLYKPSRFVDRIPETVLRKEEY